MSQTVLTAGAFGGLDKVDSKITKSTEVIAKIGFLEMQKGKWMIVPTLMYKAKAFAVRVAPKTLVLRGLKNGRAV